MICYVLAIEKQNLGPHVVVGYGIKIFRPGLFITSPDHLVGMVHGRNVRCKGNLICCAEVKMKYKMD